MEDYKKKFINFLLSTGALSFGEFMTKSGRKSPYFINTGKFNTGSLLSELGFYYASAIENSRVDFQTIFGPAYKGIPLAITTCLSLANHFKKDVPYAFNRKEAKDHGDGGLIVGEDFSKPKNIILVDDVITAGTAIREIQDMITKKFPHIKISGIFISVDRMEKGKKEISSIEEISQGLGVKIHSIVNIKEILDHIRSDQELSSKYLNKHIEKDIQDYQEKFWV